VFVPLVVALSILTFCVWIALTATGTVPDSWYRDQPHAPSSALFSFMFALAVVVIACPCAVGLAR
jgi:P-type Cu+ transporter